jgi:G3E family GTPase
MRVPVVVVTGIDPTVMDAAAMTVGWDLPEAVSVQHRIDPEAELLTRIVSDRTGVIERREIRLSHTCVSCAIREDVLPTLERLARSGRWRAIVATLPVGASPEQLGYAVAGDTRLARHLRITSVLAAMDGETLVADLLGDDLLRERGRHTGPDDARGVGEVGCHLVEYADIVAVAGDPAPVAVDLARALSRPDSLHVRGLEHLSGPLAAAHRHHHAETDAWVTPVNRAPAPPFRNGHAWRLELSATRPFHPERLVDQIERLGTGPYRSRGTFWLPTRPHEIQHWDGAGGQLSIGFWGPHRGRTLETRLLFTGVGQCPVELAIAFEDLLLTPDEATGDARRWRVAEDGLEPWLGTIERAA